MFKEIKIKSKQRHDWINVLDEVKEIVAESGVKEGIVSGLQPAFNRGIVHQFLPRSQDTGGYSGRMGPPDSYPFRFQSPVRYAFRCGRTCEICLDGH